MRKRISYRVAGLLLGTGLVAFAGGPGACEAQLGGDPDQERPALGAAIEEVRRSPFHAGARGQANAPRSIETGIGATGHHQQESGLQDEASLPGPPFGITLLFAEASHFAAAYLLIGCAYGYIDYGCVLGPALTVPAVALPAGLSGIPVAKALVASTIGLAGGIGAFVATMVVTEGISNANPFVSGLVSGLVHAGISTVLIRRWD